MNSALCSTTEASSCSSASFRWLILSSIPWYTIRRWWGTWRWWSWTMTARPKAGSLSAASTLARKYASQAMPPTLTRPRGRCTATTATAYLRFRTDSARGWDAGNSRLPWYTATWACCSVTARSCRRWPTCNCTSHRKSRPDAWHRPGRLRLRFRACL